MLTQNTPYHSAGVELESDPNSFGFFRSSADIVEDGPALSARMEEDGYLFLPGLVEPEKVLRVRHRVLDLLQKEGSLHPDHPVEEGIAAPDAKLAFRPDLVQNHPDMHAVLYEGAMMELMRRFFNEPVLHFDYTWFRCRSRGPGTPPHCDLVYMGRGTKRLYTAWVPFGVIPIEVGGLIILEKSHLQAERLKKYLEMDVDTYCANRPFGEKNDPDGWRFDGSISKNPRNLRKKMGGRWLTAEEYRPGDVLLFSMQTIHASLDNKTDVIRLSSDSRYQRASEPADHRWIGENPIAHGPEGKRGLIC